VTASARWMGIGARQEAFSQVIAVAAEGFCRRS
jgi:hypothetical protein